MGTPNGSDGLHSYGCGDYVMAIPARSGNKDGAWAFIREQHKSLDETVDLIQSRASLWVAEQYG